MSDNQPSDPWTAQPASDGTWAPPPTTTPPTMPQPAAPYQPTPYQPPPPYEPPPPYQPTQSTPPYQQTTPYQPGATPYQPTTPYQPAVPSQSEGQLPAYQSTAPYQSQGQPGANPGNPYQPGFPATNPAMTPWATAPPRKGRGPLIAIIIVAVIAVVCVGGIVAVVLNHKTASTTATKSTTTGTPTIGTTTAPPTIPAIAPGDGAGLKAHLIPLPAGAKKEKVDDSTAGVETLDQYIKGTFDGSANEKSIMKGRDFKVAAEEDWTAKNGDLVFLQLVQFGASGGADEFIHGQRGAYGGTSSTQTTYKLSGTGALGYGYETPALDKEGFRHTVVMTEHGNIAISMFISTQHSFNRASELAIMKAQVAALPA